MRHALEEMGKIDEIRILGPRGSRSSLITFNIQGVHSLDAATLLDLKGICGPVRSSLRSASSPAFRM
jgi:selenocysteine lyase/cysteine desulfurase